MTIIIKMIMMDTYEIIDEIIDLIKEKEYTIEELANMLNIPAYVLGNLFSMISPIEIFVIDNNRVKLGKLGKIINNI